MVDRKSIYVLPSDGVGVAGVPGMAWTSYRLAFMLRSTTSFLKGSSLGIALVIVNGNKRTVQRDQVVSDGSSVQRSLVYS